MHDYNILLLRNYVLKPTILQDYKENQSELKNKFNWKDALNFTPVKTCRPQDL